MRSCLGAELCRDNVSAGVLIILEISVSLVSRLSLPPSIFQVSNLSALSGLHLWRNHTVVELLPISIRSLWRHLDRFLYRTSHVLLPRPISLKGAVGSQLINHGLHLLPLELVDLDNDGILDQFSVLLSLLVEIGLLS